jgi:hypothetical protein
MKIEVYFLRQLMICYFILFRNDLSYSHTNVPDFGSQTGAGKLNLLNTNDHKLDANAFVTRNMPNIPNVSVPNFNTVGDGLDIYK